MEALKLRLSILLDQDAKMSVLKNGENRLLVFRNWIIRIVGGTSSLCPERLGIKACSKVRLVGRECQRRIVMGSSYLQMFLSIGAAF
jgi:hypothetical protein